MTMMRVGCMGLAFGYWRMDYWNSHREEGMWLLCDNGLISGRVAWSRIRSA